MSAAVRWYGPSLLPWLSPDRKFVILTPGRSGSELLTELLRCHSQIDCQPELLGGRVRSPWMWIQAHAVRAGRHADAFGFKLLVQQPADRQGLDPAAFVSRLSANGYLVVALTRRNLLRQCLSWAKASEGEYHRRSQPSNPQRAIRVEPELAIATMVINEHLMTRMRDWIKDLRQVSLVYEEDLERVTSHQATADRVFEALRLPSEPVRSTLVKLSSPDMASTVENYEELAALVRQTRFAHFLED